MTTFTRRGCGYYHADSDAVACLGHVERDAAGEVARLIGEDEAAAVMAVVREWLLNLHGNAGGTCVHCSDANGYPMHWPCPTMRAVGEPDA